MGRTFAGVISRSTVRYGLDPLAPPSELLEMCEQSLEEMGTVFHESNVYMLHMMYQAMGVCLYLEDPEEAIRYGEKIVKCYRCTRGPWLPFSLLFFSNEGLKYPRQRCSFWSLCTL